MGKVSAVFYTIANFFNWIVLLGAIAGIVFSILTGINVAPDFIKSFTILGMGFGWGSLVYFIIALLSAIVIIWMVRMAKKQGTSKGWDVLFIILGVLSANIFYILGGIFGLFARK